MALDNIRYLLELTQKVSPEKKKGLETDIHEIEPMSMEAFCKEIGMTTRNAEYYREQYERITFHTEKGKASFCRSLFTSDGSEYL